VRAAGAGSLAGVVRIRPAWLHAGSAVAGGPPTASYCRARFKIACYQPAQLQRAYNLTPLLRNGINGSGQTIVIVDSFGSPTIRHDLTVFDKGTGLPPPPALVVRHFAGPVPKYRPTPGREGWAGETDLDVEYAHAMAPRARILLVETPTAENEGTTGFPQIVQAENYVISHHLGAVISQSFSATERTFPSRQSLLRLRSPYVNAARAGLTVLAASGDNGAADARFNGSTYYLDPVTSWPDSDPLVTGVGGTRLRPGPRSGQWSSQVWNDTYRPATNRFIFGNKGPNPLAGGGGRSVVFRRPWFQNGAQAVTGTQRGVPDIAMSAACSGAVLMYQSFPGQAAGWYPTCGTSEATPLFAGVVALAAQLAGHPLGLINPRLYALAARGAGSGIVDVTAGNNTVSFRQGGVLHTVQGYQAGPGYDLASGLGTVNAALLVPRLAGVVP
jgi:subtilase family serine protease